MSSGESIRLYHSQPHPCSYLVKKEARALYLDQNTRLDMNTASRLAEMGFRRSGHFIYKPLCDRCTSCIAARIPVGQFTPNRSQRRTWNKNRKLTLTRTPPAYTEEYYSLYERYIHERHQDGEMFPPDRSQYTNFITACDENTFFLEIRLENKLVAVAVTDELDNGLSAIYTFFDPTLDDRGFGVYSLLCQIELARSMKLDYLYLGYWIQECPKMSYKTQYRPIELLQGTRWQLVSR